MKLFLQDYARFTTSKYSMITCIARIIKNYELRLLLALRIYQRGYFNGLLGRVLLEHYRKRYGIELICKNIGGGLRLIHAWGIVVNANAIIGENVTLYKGVTIGAIETGVKKGNPRIGNNVTMYANSTACGNITIGDGSIIAPGAFVNFDVPKDCIVIGNPGVIHNRY